MSGGWKKDFRIHETGDYVIKVWYRIIMSGKVRDGAKGQAVLQLDNKVRIIRTLVGVKANKKQDTKYRSYVLKVHLRKGPHWLTLGGFFTDKWDKPQFVKVLYRDVHICPH